MPYTKFNPDEMILRDHLAYDRTILANERTLLAYLRTMIALLAAGATLIKIFPEERTFVVIGTILIVLGILTGVGGAVRFFFVMKRLAATHKNPTVIPES